MDRQRVQSRVRGIGGLHGNGNAPVPRAFAALAMTLAGVWAAVAIAQNGAPSAAAAAAPLEEVVVTGTRIAAPNAVSTSPIQVISSESIATTGKTDISDIITQLPQNFNNGLGQDLGNGTSGLTTAGGVATADLRGLGPNRTLGSGRRAAAGTRLALYRNSIAGT